MLKEEKYLNKKTEADFGYVVQAIGPVIDVRFYDGLIPSLRTALLVDVTNMDVTKLLFLKFLKILDTIQ